MNNIDLRLRPDETIVETIEAYDEALRLLDLLKRQPEYFAAIEKLIADVQKLFEAGLEIAHVETKPILTTGARDLVARFRNPIAQRFRDRVVAIRAGSFEVLVQDDLHVHDDASA